MTGNSDQILEPPTLDDIKAAAENLKGQAVETPLLENRQINDTLGLRLLIKAETFQRTGAFKFRGAYNRISQLSDAECRRGVIAYSSGNHSQGVSCAAGLMNTDALIVMPDDAPENKKARTRMLGAKIITYDRQTEVREEVAAKLQAISNRVLIPPFEDRRVLAGAATVAYELIHQARICDALIDEIFVPCGGGGLIAATSIAFKALSPGTKIYGVEPELFDDTRRSLEAGKRLANPKGIHSICDAIMTDQPGALTFSINKENLAGIYTVHDDQVRHAMRFAFENFKIVVEPGAAVGLAAVLSGKMPLKGKTIAVIASGGNIDAETFCATINI